MGVESGEELQAVLAAVTTALPISDRAADPHTLEAGAGALVIQIGTTIVRVARDDEGRRRQELEIRLLPILAGRLPAAVPGPLTVLEPVDALPFGAVTYPFIPGRPLMPGDEETWPALAGDLAHLLASVHGTPVSRATAVGVPIWNAAERMDALRDDTEQCLAAALSPEERDAFAGRWTDAAAALALHSPASVLSHGDPWYDNLLIDPTSGRIVGVLDFAHAVIADPALDLAAVFHMGEHFGNAVVQGYEERRGRDASLRGRIAAHRLVREIAGLADALVNSPDEVPDQVTKIRVLVQLSTN